MAQSAPNPREKSVNVPAIGASFVAAPASLVVRGQLDVDGLERLLRRQLALYERLIDMGQQREALLTPERAEALLDVLQARQKVIDEMTGIDRELAGIRGDWPRLHATLSDAQQQRLNPLLEQVQNAHALLLQQDAKHRDVLQSRRRELGAELQHVKSTGKVAQAYKVGGQPGTSRLTNQQG